MTTSEWVCVIGFVFPLSVLIWIGVIAIWKEVFPKRGKR